jgi:hypothetical protein
MIPRVTGLVCIACLGLLGGEWWYLSGSLSAATVPAAPADLVARQPVQAPAGPKPVSLDSMVEVILQRPLFSRTRRPTAVPDASGSARVATLPRLSGIIQLPGYLRAIFQSAGTPKPTVTVVAEAGTIEDWTVRTIDSGAVTLVRNGEILQLAPAFGAPATPPPRPRIALTRWEAPADHGMLRARWSNPQLQP